MIRQLLKRIETLEERVSELEIENTALKAENAELRARLGKSSRNSNRPPSSDGPKKGAPKNSREPSDRQSGAQPGHEGKTRLMKDAPDRVIKLQPKTECECGGRINTDFERYTPRQVEDVVPVQVMTIEYRAHDGVCEKCGKVHKASFPEGVDSPVTIGANARAIAAYLTNYQLVPLKRTTEMMSDLLGIRISEGTIVRISEEAYNKLEASEKAIKREIVEEDVAHFDETGMRRSGEESYVPSLTI